MAGGGAFIAGAIASKMLLDVSSWRKGVSDVESDKTKMNKSAKTTSQRIAGIGRAATVAGIAIVGAFGKMISSYVSAGDEIDKMSLRTGISAASLSELRFAAQIAGTTIGTMEKGIKKMSKTIIDADTGLETYVRSFDRIGISVDELLKLNPEDQFMLIGEAIAGLATDTEKAATAQEIFGRAGTELLPLFKQGAEGISELRQQARDLGIVFDQEAATKAAKLQDAQTALSESFKGMAFALASALVPAVTEIVDKITDVVVKVREWATANPQLFATVTKVVGVLGLVLATLGPMLIMMPRIVKGIKSIGLAMKFLAMHPALLLVAALGAIVIGFMKVKAAQAEAEKASKRYEEITGRLDKKLLGIAERAGLTADEFENLKKKYNNNTNALVKAIRTGKEGIKLQESMIETGEKNVAVQEAARIEWDLQIPTLEDVAAATETVAEKQKTWIDYLAETGIKTTKEKSDRVDELERFMRELNEAYKDGKVDVQDWKTAIASAEDEIESLTETIGETIPLAARDMADAFGAAIDQAGLKVHDLPPEVEKAGKLIVGQKDSIWNKMSDGMKTQWTNMWSDFARAESWNDILGAIKTFGANIVQQVADIAAQAMAKWTAGFITKMISGTANMATDVVGSVADVGKSVLDIAKGFSPGGMIATAVGTAVGTFLGSILGPKGPSATDTRLIKEYNFEAKQHLFNLAIIADAMKWSLWNMEPLAIHTRDNTDQIKETLWNQSTQLANIAANTKATVKLLRSKKSGQHGTIIDEPDFAFVHGSPDKREFVIPEADLGRVGGRGGGDVNVNITLNNPVMSRDYTRNEIIPEMIEAIKSGVHKSKFQEALGMA